MVVPNVLIDHVRRHRVQFLIDVYSAEKTRGPSCSLIPRPETKSKKGGMVCCECLLLALVIRPQLSVVRSPKNYYRAS